MPIKFRRVGNALIPDSPDDKAAYDEMRKALSSERDDDPYDTARDTRRDDRDVHGF